MNFSSRSVKIWDVKMIKSYFLLLFILTFGQSLKLFGQVEQVWAIIGKSLTLNCNSENAGRCRWRNPRGELISGEFCILRIEAITQRDMGQWYCMASSNDKVDKVFDLFTSSFYAHRSQKCKKLLNLTVFLALLGSVCVKAACEMLVKFTQGGQSL